jgi:hypothetical protein
MGPTVPLVHLRKHLRVHGYDDRELRRLLRDGELTPIRRGAYLPGEAPDDPEVRHLAQIAAAARQLGPGAVLSHQSAAVLHGWDLWRAPLQRVQVTRSRRTGGRVDPSVHVRAAPLDRCEVVEVGGLRVTSRARTAADLARTLPAEQAVVATDSALGGPLTKAELREALRRQKGWPGAPRARRVVEFADGRSGSVGESRSRWAITLAGIPAPDLQHEVRDHGGRHVGTVDFWWEARRLAGEFDGLVKYGRLLRPGRTAADAVVAEKLREDDLRDQDVQMVRWTWSDLSPFTTTAARLRRRLGM